MILACPTCDGRYDVTGYAVGQQLRCRCGTVMTRPAEKMQAGLLACPQCGGGVSPTSSKCEYCSADLLLKSCPRCLSRVFHGHKHCPECGAELDIAAAVTERKDLPCPRCTTSLRARMVGDIVIDECGTCLGLFLDHVAIQRVITDRAQARAEALLGALPRAEVRQTVKPGERMYVKCPSCAIRFFTSGSAIDSRNSDARRSMMRGLVPAGAARTHQFVIASCGNPASTVVGTSGISARRWRASTASTRILPDFSCDETAGSEGNATWMSPASSAVTMGDVPLYGMYTMEFPVCCENSVPTRNAGVPTPGEP